jgi:hypothetical protein
MSIHKPAERSTRRQSLRLLGRVSLEPFRSCSESEQLFADEFSTRLQEVLPHKYPSLATLPPDILVRIIRLSLPRPTSATDPAISERPRQILALARVCRYFAHWALPELAGEVLLPDPINYDALLATLRPCSSARLFNPRVDAHGHFGPARRARTLCLSLGIHGAPLDAPFGRGH